jgi:hypothetical protein
MMEIIPYTQRKDPAPYEKVVLNKTKKAEVRIYDGDKDPNILNRKRIGVYLFIDNEFSHSEWIECGKIINNTIVNNPKMTIKKKKDLIEKAVKKMRSEWRKLNVSKQQ